MDLTEEEKTELFDKHGDEICEVCSWKDEGHLGVCEGCRCEEAIDTYLEDQKAEDEDNG